MKVFFTSSITGLKKYKNNYELIAKIIQDHGYNLYSGFMKVTKEKERSLTIEESKKVYNYIIERINVNDVFIAEMSYRSAPVSYQLTYAIEHNKPSLYLYEKGTGSIPNPVFTGNPSKYLVIREYNKTSIESILLEFLEDSKRLLMKRFNFVIPSELDEYLSISSAFEGISKGELVRKLIEENMNKDARYKEVMKARNMKLNAFDT